MNERNGRKRLVIGVILIAILVTIFTLSCVGSCSEEKSTSEVITLTDEEKVLKAIVRPLNVGMLGEIIVAEEEDMQIIQEYVREHYNILEEDDGLRLNENYCLWLSLDRDLSLIYTDSNRVEYVADIRINIDIPREEILNSDYYVSGYHCQWTVKGNEVSKWILGEKVDSFNIPEGLTVITDDAWIGNKEVNLWLGQKDEKDHIKMLYYFSIEERKCIEVSTSTVAGFGKVDNSIFYLDLNKKMWHFNLLTNEKEIIYEDVENISIGYYYNPDTISSDKIVYGERFYNEFLIPPYYINDNGEKTKLPTDIEREDVINF